MNRILGSLRRVAAAALLVASASLAGCGVGGSGEEGGAYTTIVFENVDPSASITEAEFDFFDLSGLPNRVESFLAAPGSSVEFDFEQFESDNFLDVTLTWSDASTTTIPLLLISGGEYTYPVAR
jgi:hypothetical protein